MLDRILTKYRDWRGKDHIRWGSEWVGQKNYVIEYITEINGASFTVARPTYKEYRHKDTGEKVALFVLPDLCYSETRFEDVGDKTEGETTEGIISKADFEKEYDWIYGGERHGLSNGHYTDLEAV